MEKKIISIAEYQEMEKLLPFQVKTLRSKLQDKHKLIIPRECDEFLIRCIRLKNGHLEKALHLILCFHTAVADFQHWDVVLQPSFYREFFNSLILAPLRQRDPLGRRVCILRTGMWDPSSTSFDIAFACLWMFSQYLNAECIDTQRNGFVMIWDHTNISAKHALALNYWRFVSLAKWAQNGIMGRIKAYHAINHVKLVGLIYSGLKPFLKEKLKKRVHFHSSLDSLLEHFEADKLPTYLGGTLKYEDCIDMQFVHNIFKYDDYFKEMMINRLPSK